MPEPQIELSKDDKAILRTARAVEALLASDGWKIYSAALQAHLDYKRAEYEAPTELLSPDKTFPLDGISQVLRAESAKGAILGIRLALSLPHGMVQAGDNLRIEKGLKTAGDE